MKREDKEIWENQKKLILARLESTDSNIRITLGNKKYTVKDLIKHIKKEDKLGKKIVDNQIKLIQTFKDLEDIKRMDKEGKINLKEYEKISEK